MWPELVTALGGLSGLACLITALVALQRRRDTVRDAARKATEKTEQRITQHFEKMLRERDRELRAVNEVNDKLIDRLARAETREEMLQAEVARLRGFGGDFGGEPAQGRHLR